MGFVYFVRCPATGLVKIGHAADPRRRLAQLRTISPTPIEPLGLIRGGTDRERELHARFRSHWSHGEWFRPSPDLAAFVAAHARPWSPRPAAFARSPVARSPRRPTVAEWAAATRIDHRGLSLTVAEWARLRRISPETIRARLGRGHDLDWALGYRRLHRRSPLARTSPGVQWSQRA